MIMDALYTVKLKYTYEEYRKFYYSCQQWKTLVICFIIMLFLLVNSIIEKHIVVTCLAIGFFIWFPLFMEYHIKKSYKTKKSNGEEVTLRFYEEYIEGAVSNSVTKVLYKNLYKVRETKTSCYIMMGANQAFIVTKDICSDNLAEFIRKLKKD